MIQNLQKHQRRHLSMPPLDSPPVASTSRIGNHGEEPFPDFIFRYLFAVLCDLSPCRLLLRHFRAFVLCPLRNPLALRRGGCISNGETPFSDFISCCLFAFTPHGVMYQKNFSAGLMKSKNRSASMRGESRPSYTRAVRTDNDLS